jgi:hypothetical protein
MHWIRVFLAASLIAVGAAASAANLGFLGNAPISRMTAEDIDLLYAAAVEVLDNARDGDAMGWENPATNASGSLRPLDTYTGKNGETCRTLRVINRASGMVTQNTFPLCKGPDGWKMTWN